MSKSQRTTRRRGSAAKSAVPKSIPVVVPPSLPLAVPDATDPPSFDHLAGLPTCPRCGTRILNYLKKYCGICQFKLPLTVRDPSKALLPPGMALPDDSKQREKALQIFTYRQAGMSYEEIAPLVGLTTGSVPTYLYKAARNGWLDGMIDTPKERMEYEIFDKVVQRLDEALESDAILNTGMKESTAVALKIGEGTLFNRPGEASQAAQQNNTVIAVKVEVVGGEPQKMREGTISGTSTYLEGVTTPED